jgi:hypothetical protein
MSRNYLCDKSHFLLFNEASLYTRSDGQCSFQIKPIAIGAKVEISLKGFVLRRVKA